MLGLDQPLYVINANGMDGQQPTIDNVGEMVLAYLQEMDEAQPTGVLRVGGMCAGCFVAIEIARALQEKGRQTGPIILVDPPVIPIGYEQRRDTTDVKPELADRLYEEVRSRFIERLQDPDGYDDLPFDPQEPKQLDAAVAVAIRTMVAFARHVPHPFGGPAEVIISHDRSAAFLHPRMPWAKVLFGSRLVHVVPWSHREMFRSGRRSVARLIKSALEEEPVPETVLERRMPSALTNA
jgi:thioesterase domain-containing protein